MEILFKYSEAFIGGALTTLQIAVISWVAGIALGCVLGFFSILQKWFKLFLSYFSFFLTAIPILVLLFWFHYPMQTAFRINIDPLITSIFLFTLINAVIVAQIISQNEDRMPEEYVQSAVFAGLSYFRVFSKIQLPMVLRSSLPSIVTTQVTILHMTLFASLISVNELFRTAQRINSLEYQPVEIYTIIAVFYVAISAPLLYLSGYFKRHLHSIKLAEPS